MTLSDEPAVTQIEEDIDHSWSESTPIAGLGINAISARWTADLEIAIADTFTFITTSDDGVRLWLDDELLIDNWTDHGPMDDYSQPLELGPGIYGLQMDWYNLQAGATAQLWWETPTMNRQIIPAGPLQPPLRAMPLYPVDAAVNVSQVVSLAWAASDTAVLHDVYFGEDADAVAADLSPDGCFNHVWVSSLLERALEEVEIRCHEDGKTVYWKVFEERALQPIVDESDPPSVRDLCDRYGIPDGAKLANMIVTVKRRVRAALEEYVQESVMSTDSGLNQKKRPNDEIGSLGRNPGSQRQDRHPRREE
jgi:PA14 domain